MRPALLLLLPPHYHDGGDDGDEGIAVGQEPVGGLGTAAGVSVQERGGGSAAPPGLLLLHVLLHVVLDNVAVVVSLHRGGATGAQVTQRRPWTLPADCLQTAAIS